MLGQRSGFLYVNSHRHLFWLILQDQIIKMLFSSQLEAKISAFLQGLTVVHMSLPTSGLKASPKGPNVLFYKQLLIGNSIFNLIIQVWQYFLADDSETNPI